MYTKCIKKHFNIWLLQYKISINYKLASDTIIHIIKSIFFSKFINAIEAPYKQADKSYLLHTKAKVFKARKRYKMKKDKLRRIERIRFHMQYLKQIHFKMWRKDYVLKVKEHKNSIRKSHYLKQRVFNQWNRLAQKHARKHLLKRIICTWKKDLLKTFMHSIYREWRNILVRRKYRQRVLKCIIISKERILKKMIIQILRQHNTNYYDYKKFNNMTEIELSKQRLLNEEVVKIKEYQQRLAYELYSEAESIKTAKENVCQLKEKEMNIDHNIKEMNETITKLNTTLDLKKAKVLNLNNEEVTTNKDLKQLLNQVQSLISQINSLITKKEPNVNNDLSRAYTYSNLGIKAKDTFRNRLQQLKNT